MEANEKLVGPDLRSLTNRSRDGLLSAILDPSQTIDPKYLSYAFVLRNGETLSGVVAEEGANSVTIADANGKTRTILRASLEIVKRSSKSIMPEGFETKISPREMSDLIAYVREL